MYRTVLLEYSSQERPPYPARLRLGGQLYLNMARVRVREVYRFREVWTRFEYSNMQGDKEELFSNTWDMYLPWKPVPNDWAISLG